MPNKRILLVEDDFMNMKLTQHILEGEGYTVLRATTGGEALEQMESTLPDLILMDIRLPDMDGLSVVRILRENSRTKGTTVLALTACAMQGDRERILQAGCDGYISKPISVQNLLETISRFLNPRT